MDGKACLVRGAIPAPGAELPSREANSRLPLEAACPAPHGKPIDVKPIENNTQLETLREEWNPLLRSSNANTLFLTWEWLYTWWTRLGGNHELRALAIRHGSRLIGLAPLALGPRQLRRLRPFRRLGFMGTGTVGSDYLDLIVACGEEQAALTAMARHLADARLALEFRRVSAGGTATASLAAKLEEQGWTLGEFEDDICPYVSLGGHDWKSYFASLGPSHRPNLHRRLNQLQRSFTMILDEARNQTERRKYLRIFMQLHQKRWNRPSGSDAINSSAIVAFHEEFSRLALERGWLRLYVLRLDGRPVAAVYGFKYDDVFYYYQSGFDPEFKDYSVGMVALGLTIRRALNEGVRELDFLHGAERYKFLWANETRHLVRFHCYPPTVSGRAVLGTEKIRASMKTLHSRGLRTRRP